jgi:hypothetical protein
VPTASPTPAERFATLLLWLVRAVDSQRLIGRLAMPLMILIVTRIREIRQRLTRLAARVAAGTYSPRASGGPRPGRPPGSRNRLPGEFAWLLKLVPEAAASASQLQFLLADPEIAALIATAPVPMGRALRPLFWMLGLRPPPILAPPAPPPVQAPTRPLEAEPPAPSPGTPHRQARPPRRPPIRDASGPPPPA